jgi:hypothetical protein
MPAGSSAAEVGGRRGGERSTRLEGRRRREGGGGEKEEGRRRRGGGGGEEEEGWVGGGEEYQQKRREAARFKWSEMRSHRMQTKQNTCGFALPPPLSSPYDTWLNVPATPAPKLLKSAISCNRKCHGITRAESTAAPQAWRCCQLGAGGLVKEVHAETLVNKRAAAAGGGQGAVGNGRDTGWCVMRG